MKKSILCLAAALILCLTAPCALAGTFTLPDNLTSIEYGAFMNDTSLTRVTIPDGVTSIGARAFSGCVNLTSVIIPSSVSTIGLYAFSGCSGLTVQVTAGSPAEEYCIDNSIPYLAESPASDFTWINRIDGAITITKYNGSDSTVVIPKEINGKPVAAIDGYAFYRNTRLTNLVIPEGVTSIYEGCFEGCTRLESVSFPDSLTAIGSGAFGGCKSLKSVVLGTGVTHIQNAAFAGCTNLTSVTLSPNLESIGAGAFMDCAKVYYIRIPESVTFIGSGAFYYDCTLQVKKDSYAHNYCKENDLYHSLYYGSY